MKHFVPDYYSHFACIQGACRHSCCIGWEIDIDENTLEYYRNISHPIGEKLKQNISEQDGCACFRLAEDERCPFLDENGLCELILNLGEDSLCQICADHPRFRNFFSDREETGLALCCEAAGRLILENPQPTNYICIADDGVQEETNPEEQAILSLREELLQLIQNRDLPFRNRLNQLMAFSGMQADIDSCGWADFLMRLERLDEAWTLRLKKLADLPENLPELPDTPAWNNAFEQLAVYMVMRHIPPALDDGMTAQRIVFCALICKLLETLLRIHAFENNGANMDDFIEIARLYSSEIEYSDENIEAILDEITLRKA